MSQGKVGGSVPQAMEKQELLLWELAVIGR